MIDPFETRTMLAAVEQMDRAKSFLRDTFFQGEKTFDTKHVDLDIRKGGRKIAAYVSPLAESKVVEKDGYQTSTFTPPYVKEKEPIQPSEFLNRPAGAVLYAPGQDPATRLQQETGRILADLDDRFSRLEEVQAAQALNAGIVTCVGEGVNATVDFGMDANHKITLAGTDLWSDAQSDPIKNYIDWCDLVAKDSGLVPDVSIIGLDAWKAARTNQAFLDALNNRRVNVGQIDPRQLPNGVTYLGDLEEAGVSISLYIYKEWYEDPSTGLLTPMVPADKVWLGSTRARCRKLYGAIQDIDAGGLAAVRRYPKSWTVKDPSVRWVQLQSAPLMAMEQPDGFASAQVL